MEVAVELCPLLLIAIKGCYIEVAVRQCPLLLVAVGIRVCAILVMSWFQYGAHTYRQPVTSFIQVIIH